MRLPVIVNPKRLKNAYDKLCLLGCDYQLHNPIAPQPDLVDVDSEGEGFLEGTFMEATDGSAAADAMSHGNAGQDGVARTKRVGNGHGIAATVLIDGNTTSAAAASTVHVDGVDYKMGDLYPTWSDEGLHRM